jgi:flagellar hook-associated protein 1 FlgK
MSNIFGGIYRANDALTAARYGLEVTGQNIANANTPGYTRQRADQVAVGTAVGVPTLHSGTVDNGGVRAAGAQRLADQVLNTRARDEHARSAQIDTQTTRIADVENIFREPSDNGLAEQLHDFWNAWGDVADDPGAQVPREMLIQSGQATVTMLRSMDSALDSVATAAKNSLEATLESANSAAAELADLNRKIAIGDATKTNVNTLLDRRDVLLDQLSSAVGAKAQFNTNGTVNVTVGGQPLVVATDGKPPFEAGILSVAYSQADPPQGASVSITPPGGTAADITAALTDSAVKAEAQTLNVTVPDYRAKLDAVASGLATTVNATVQANGHDLSGAPGEPMFTGTTAKDIAVAGGFGWQNVAASGTASPSGNVDGSNALMAADLSGTAGSPDSAYSSLIGELGRASASARQQQTTQSVITSSVDTLQATASGVSFDEEVSNLLTYQMAFQASSRVLTTLDSMLDTLINRTGLVGRA